MTGRKFGESVGLSKDVMLEIMDRIRSGIENDTMLSPPSHRLQGSLDAAIQILDEIAFYEPLQRTAVAAAQDMLRSVRELSTTFIDGDVECEPGNCLVCLPPKGRRCSVCGCTDDDCSTCVERTGGPCFWVGEDLCSACAVA